MRNMPRYVIHIGPHKTGSSYLQAAFQALRSQFLEHGVWYPEQWQGEDKLGHHRLVHRLRTKTDEGLAEDFAFLNGSSYETILISAEDLSDLKPEEIAQLRILLGECSSHVIFYCRRWSELLPSGWQELIKHGHTTTFSEFLSTCFINPFSSHVINYSRTLRRYAECFGISNLSLVSYSNIMDDDGDIFANFCKNFLAWKDPPKPVHSRVNVSLAPMEVELIRALSAIEWSRTGRKSDEIIHGYRRNLGKLDLSLPLSAMEKCLDHAKINEGVGPLENLHGVLFKEFGSLLVEPRAGPRLFVPKLSEVPYVRQDYLLSDGVVGSLQGIYREIRGQV
jgi:hypothetical protein